MPKRFAFQVVGKHPTALNITRDPTMAGEGTGLGPVERVRPIVDEPKPNWLTDRFNSVKFGLRDQYREYLVGTVKGLQVKGL